MKYYVITIASIFIALGIGIFIGFNINSDDLYLSQQQIIVDTLEEKFSEMNIEKESFSKQIEELMIENEKNTTFIDKIYTEIIKNKLNGLNVGIIITSEDYYYQDIRLTLEKSGANVPAEFQFKNKIFNISQEKIEEINARFDLKLNNKDELLSTINQEIVYFFTFGKKRTILDFLLDENYIKFSGNVLSVESQPIHFVVIAGGGLTEDKRIETLDIDIIRRCLQNAIPVVGVERHDVGYSYMPHYQQMNISTIDNVNKPMGRISLISVLGGEMGHFGEKEHADRLIPFYLDE